MSLPLLQLQSVSRSYRKRGTSVFALREVTLDVKQGEFVAVWGPSGSGKSTLLNIMGTLDYASEGQYLFGGQNVTNYSDEEISRFRAANIGFIFQSYNLLPHLSAWENVALPARYTGQRFSKVEGKARAVELLEQVGLSERADHLPTELSGGEEQRVAIARALMNNPQVILADEPTGNLDSKNHTAMLEMLQVLHAQGKTLLVVSHNPEVVGIAQRTIRLKDGILAE